MEQLAFFEIPNPCVGICQSDERGYCKGCFRSREERFGWQQFSDARKADVIRLCKARKRRRQLALLKQLQLQQQQQQAQLLSQNPQLSFDEPDEDRLDFSGFELD
ncbi:DUF1289 domain-containing protein [Shewanella sp. YIC-542]|uniref:DUF1289 domain-containing protein n=1 Tax=Shewanella mytili TaxID=3377111 RepID=UPI00398ED5D6